MIVSVDQTLELGGIRISESSLRAVCQSYVEFTPQARIGFVKFGALMEELGARSSLAQSTSSPRTA